MPCPRSLRTLGVVIALVLTFAGCAAVHPGHDAGLFRQPAEFEAQEAVWMSAEPDDPEVMRITTDLASALMDQVRVRMVLRDAASLAATRESLRRSGVRVDGIEFSVDSLATFFMRDGTVYLVNGKGDPAVLDLEWSRYGLPGWCQRLYPDDPVRAAQCAGYVNAEQDGFERSLARASKAAVVSSPLFLENACFEGNGKGS